MITFEKGKKRFAFRIAGVAILDRKVLLHKSVLDDFWALPGGRCEFLENSRDTLIREMKEEMGVEINIIRPLYFVENFFEYENRDCHEVSIIYLMDFPPKSKKIIEKDIFYGNESQLGFEKDEIYGKKLKIIFRWFSINELENLEVYPSFLRTSLQNIKPYPEHIIHKDN
ncbi:MAG: NUDIX hydrolase [Candidatus Hermodarchaeota archaeon]